MIRKAFLMAALVLATPALAAPEMEARSPDGKWVARIEPVEGDWRRIDIADARTGQVREHLDNVAYSSVAWAPDSSGIYYSRMPAPSTPPVPGTPPAPPRGFHEVDFHRLGTPQSEEELVYFTDRFNMFHTAEVTADGRWLVVTSSLNREPRHEIVLIRRDQAVPAPWKLIRTLSHVWRFAGSQGDQFYFVTDLDAPRSRLVAIDIDSTRFVVREVVPQAADTLKAARLTAKGIELTYTTSTRTIPMETAQ